jgi:NADH dehydrogenase [ubiquinone] 1 alpha subcomplex assembly factor 7
VTSALGRLLARRIALTGPMSIADFMTEALGHPRLGYYRRALPVGAAGDFTTAPEVSQMFGELLGAWLAERWQAMDGPDLVRLIELGPGRGTLLADALRATRAVTGFHAALKLHLVEVNEPLRALQRAALAAFDPSWHASLAEVPAGPTLLVANEFFDALPIRQFEKAAWGWAERMVALAPTGDPNADPGGDAAGASLAFTVTPGPSPFAHLLPDAIRLSDAAPGTVAEVSPSAAALARELGARLVSQGGWALIVDYGRDLPAAGATLQAVRGHRGTDPLERPGETDLSAWVDFASLAAAAHAAGARAFGPVSQRDFLQRLGIGERATALKRHASAAEAAAIDAALARLIGPDQMGSLFRVLAVGDNVTSAPAGFSDGR